MARPRITKLPCGGEMILKNVPAANADAIQALVLGQPEGVMKPACAYPNEGEIIEVDSIGNIKVNSTRTFSLKALTTRFNPVTLNYELISVEVDPDTQETGNIEVLREERNQMEIKAAFKVMAITMGVV